MCTIGFSKSRKNMQKTALGIGIISDDTEQKIIMSAVKIVKNIGKCKTKTKPLLF
jgi:hypothetical protein